MAAMTVAARWSERLRRVPWRSSRVRVDWGRSTTAHGRVVVAVTGSTRLSGGDALLPTPMAHEPRLGYQDRTRGKKGTQESLTTVVFKQIGTTPKDSGLTMSTVWVGILMGYPLNWLNASSGRGIGREGAC